MDITLASRRHPLGQDIAREAAAGWAVVETLNLDSDSKAFLTVRADDGTVVIGFGVDANGDLDLVVSRADARRIGEAILQAAGHT